MTSARRVGSRHRNRQMNLPRFAIVAGVVATMLSAQAQSQMAAAPAPGALRAPTVTGTRSSLADTAPAPAPPSSARNRNPLAFAAHVAATVNDEVITTYDLQQRMLLLIVTSGVQPTEQNAPELQRESLRGLVDERLQLQEIHRIQTKQKLHIEPTDKEVDEELTDLARSNNMKLEQLAAQLRSNGVSLQTLRDQTRAQVAWRRYMGGRFGNSIRITDDQIRAALVRIKASAAKPQFLVSEIFLDAQRVGGADIAVNGARQLIEQLQKGAPFQAVARQFSSAASAQSGGDDGWLVSGEIQPALQAALEAGKPGQLLGPIETPEGAYILLLRDKRAGSSSIMANLKTALIRMPATASATQVAAAMATLNAARGKAQGCDGFEAAMAKVDGAYVGETGETDIVTLTPAFQSLVQTSKVNDVSPAMRTPMGVQIVALCGKRQGGAHEPGKAEVENRLYGEQLGMLAKRFLRDLHNSATIEAK